MIPFTFSSLQPQPTQFTQPHLGGFPGCPALTGFATEEGYSSACGHVERIQQHSGVKSWTRWTVLSLPKGRADGKLCESVPSLPACPLYQSFGPINTVTPITTTSYLQENKPVGKLCKTRNIYKNYGFPPL